MNDQNCLFEEYEKEINEDLKRIRDRRVDIDLLQD
jgi:hypothetical protein